MPTIESNAAYAELSGRIDQQFPFSKLLQWAAELKEANYVSPIDQEQLMQLVSHVTSHRMFRETLLSEFGLGNRDISIVCPSTGRPVEIHYGSDFWPHNLFVLEDPQLNRVVPTILGDTSSRNTRITRSAFSAAIDGAAIAVGSIVVPHHLPLRDVDTVVQWHALRTAMSPLFKNDQEAVMCFYGGMKIITNRLLYGVDRVA